MEGGHTWKGSVYTNVLPWKAVILERGPDIHVRVAMEGGHIWKDFWLEVVTLNPVDNQTGKRHFICVSMATNQDFRWTLVTVVLCHIYFAFFYSCWPRLFLPLIRNWNYLCLCNFFSCLLPSFTKAKTFAKCPSVYKISCFLFLLFLWTIYRPYFSRPRKYRRLFSEPTYWPRRSRGQYGEGNNQAGIFEAEGNKSLIPGRLVRSPLTCPSTRKVRDERVVSLCSECCNATTLAKNIVTAEIFMRLIRSAIMWYHATSTSISNASLRPAEPRVVLMSNKARHRTSSHDRTVGSTSWISRL